MPANAEQIRSFKLQLPLSREGDLQAPSLPEALTRPGSRGASGEAQALLAITSVKASYELAAASRSMTAPVSARALLEDELLALEAEDGSTIFIRADRLRADLERLYPEAIDADGEIDLALFRDRNDTSRGLGSWIWRRLSVLQLNSDAIIEEARRQATEWLGGAVAERLATRLGDQAVFAASQLGTKALMATIESRLAGDHGLYQWRGGDLLEGDLCLPGDARLVWNDEPALVFIHGTGSGTVGSFGDLARSEDWHAFRRAFGERIFGFEHRTFSESPVDNALALANCLPVGARISLVTHSRGGLVGDLLSLGSLNPAGDLVRDFRREPRPDEEEAEAADASGELRALRERTAEEERAKLQSLIELLDRKALRVECYVRVACPAAGTALLSDNLEVFLSGLLALVRKLGAWGAGAVAGMIASPLAGAVVRRSADQGLQMLSRIVLEIAAKRLQPQFVPGIEAMLPDAPLGAFLGRAPRTQGVRMAVIAGDVEGSGLLGRIGVMFTDWMLFDRADNDLVVDTASMYGGLVAANGGHALFDQGEEVNHFSYFRNPRTRSALRDWLLDQNAIERHGWANLPSPTSLAEAERAGTRGKSAAPPDDSRPVVILLPGIMGSHLEVNRRTPDEPGSGDRVWMAPLDLVAGGLRKIARGASGVAPEDLVSLGYGKLVIHLEASHRVIRFPYDWRLDPRDAAKALASVVEAALAAHPHQPLRLLAHSMGGVVARTFIAVRPDLWNAIAARPGGRLLMLGTPNHGSHLMVETLLGKSETIRLLARIDARHGLQSVLDIVAGFNGALQLLPEPGFSDTAGPQARDFHAADTWPELAERNNDFWFGKRLAGLPDELDLKAADECWKVIRQGDEFIRLNADRVAYVYGQAENTPCGIRVGEKSIEMLGTPHGDGSVTWASGKLDALPDERCWFMPADHMGLCSTAKYFDEISSLLATGVPRRLGHLPVARSAAAAPVRAYQPGPAPGFPSEEGLMVQLLGGRPRTRLPPSVRQSLRVSVRAMDLRFVRVPLLCGHYLDDPISGPEAVIDQHLVEFALSRRHRLGVHAGEIGSVSVVLMPRCREDLLRRTGRGAVVVGLGEMGKLTSRAITETVRAGVLRLLLHSEDRCAEAGGGSSDIARDQVELRLASLLIGSNSTAHLSPDESVKAVVLGVCEANQQFAAGLESDHKTAPEGVRNPARVVHLEFIEIYRDAAITAARAVRVLPQVLARDLQRLKLRLEADQELHYGEGVRTRLSVSPASGYWPRLIVTDADAADSECGPECYQVHTSSPFPPEIQRALLAGRSAAEAGALVTGGAEPAPLRYARRLRFTYLGQRARAESIIQQRQPGVAETLVADAIANTRYVPETGIGTTLFHLLVPPDFKVSARESSNLLLVVDGTTANLPWEMLEIDGDPLVLRRRMVRQLVSTRFRPAVRTTRTRTALLIANPSTRGYYAQFGGPDWKPSTDVAGRVRPDRLPSLAGAERELQKVLPILERRGYKVESTEPDALCGDVFGRLFRRPYRIMVVSAHGIFQVRARDGGFRSGVALSDGLVLSAAEIGLMEVVPEFVFLNCCHLGRADAAPSAAGNRLAYSLARELIEVGVRCVIAAGWEVDDDAGCTFAEAFFKTFVEDNENFAEAVFAARCQVRDRHPDSNTFGAYQAYGDPTFRLEIEERSGAGTGSLVTPEELLDWVAGLRVDAYQMKTGGMRGGAPSLDSVAGLVDARLRDVPGGWVERPDVQQHLGLLFAEYGRAGFARARLALQRAIAEEARSGVVALICIEQLANIEAREAMALASVPGQREEALRLIEIAIKRLSELVRITGADPTGSVADTSATAGRPVNTERLSILGSALKRKAILLAIGGEKWSEVGKVLRAARDAYHSGEGSPETGSFNPYALINRLQLDALLGEVPDDLEVLIERCTAAARQRYGESFDFFDAVMPVDAALASLLHPKAALETTDERTGKPVSCFDGLAVQYHTAIRDLSPSPRKFDSVVAQLRHFVTLLRLRNAAGDKERAGALEALAVRLSPDSDASRREVIAPAEKPAVVEGGEQGPSARSASAAKARSRARKPPGDG